jgi:hypothetical protein
MLNRMREVYSTAGIRVEVVSRENLTGPAFTHLIDLDVPQDAQGNPVLLDRQATSRTNFLGTAITWATMRSWSILFDPQYLL